MPTTVFQIEIQLLAVDVHFIDFTTASVAASPQKAPLAGSLYPQHRVSSDEDPYSLSPAESSGSSGKGLRQTR